ncbi:hypothetical protein SUGI_0290290 [Cryptomeria japonica]|nr:hypothetical protein SUGI_0290290 [Cryptomeria japonica]
MGKLKTLWALDLQENKLSGSIPDSLAHLKQLRYLYLNNNQLSGIIPPSLGECLKLENLELSYNNLRGHLPPQVAGLSNLLRGFNLSNNLLQGPLPLELSKLDKVKAIDISANQFIGHIPFVLGSCVALEYLNLSCNQIEGLIPESLGKLQNLQNLDFSSNKLSGRIPMSLGNLKELQRLNFSMNRLSGKVPKDGVFKILGPSSFIQNPGLCGPWVKLLACSALKHKRHTHLKRVIITIVGIATLVIWWLLMRFLCRRYCKRHPLISFPSRLDHQKILLSELTNATDGFSEANLLGVGNFGKLYKGVLNDGTMVAVKVLSLQNEQVSSSFVRECNVLRRVRHRNLVRIITTYSDPDFKALILPLMPNGSLNKCLHPEGPQSSEGHMPRLDLIQRLNIAINIAQALEYLHHHCFVQVIHCDIKPSNVLLGEDMTAYLTDFGISRLISGNSINSFTSTDTLKGSIGYMAPEYGVSGRVTTKGDVYNYGIMLLEMVTGKRPTEDLFVLFVEGMNMQKWVSRSFPNTIAEIVDSSLLNGVTSSAEDKRFGGRQQEGILNSELLKQRNIACNNNVANFNELPQIP